MIQQCVLCPRWVRVASCALQPTGLVSVSSAFETFYQQFRPMVTAAYSEIERSSLALWPPYLGFHIRVAIHLCILTHNYSLRVPGFPMTDPREVGLMLTIIIFLPLSIPQTFPVFHGEYCGREKEV